MEVRARRSLSGEREDARWRLDLIEKPEGGRGCVRTRPVSVSLTKSDLAAGEDA